MRRSRQRSRRAIVASVLMLSLVGTATTSLAAGPWPDGEWYGFISGGGVASGSLTVDSGTVFGSGSAIASGLFFLDIVDGEAKGEYGITWRGQAAETGGTGGTQVIEELGIVEGTGGIPSLVRESATGSTTIDGITVPFNVPRLPPAPTPMEGDYADCQVVEGTIEGKLTALAEAFAAFGFKVAAEESFTAYRIFGETAAEKEFITKRMEQLNDIATGFGQLIFEIPFIGLGQAIVDAEALVASAEAILAELEGIPDCDGVDVERFSLGISSAIEVFILGALQFAVEQLDGKAIANLAALAGRAGVLEKVSGLGMDAVMSVAPQAIFDKDITTLEYLVAASVAYGDGEYAVFLVNEIEALRGSS